MESDRKPCGCVLPDNMPCNEPSVDFVEVQIDRTSAKKFWMCRFHYDGWMARNKTRVFEVKNNAE